MEKTSVSMRLSTLWIVVLFNMLFADICSIMIALVDKNTIAIPADVALVMAVAAIITNVPILMIYFSRVLKHRLNRLMNILAALLTALYVILGGSTTPHYFIIAGIELIFLLLIVITAAKWAEPSKT